MNKFQVIFTLAVVSFVSAEPPVLSGGYGYRRPSHSSSSHSGLHTSVSHGISSFGISGNDIGGAVHYSTGGGGFQSNEGLYVDPDLLHKVKEILLQHENLEQQHRNQHNNHHHHHHHHISDSYGPPSIQYGPPQLDERIVGIELGHIRPSIQVAHLHQAELHHVPSISYGVPNHHHSSIPSGSYGPPSIPSGSYGPPSIPSGSYGPPSIPSGSYGAPAETYVPPSIHAPSASYGVPSVSIQIPSGSYGVPDHHH